MTALIIGYLIGSIPFGLVLAKASGLGDIRKIGSGNIGATNVLRTGNKKIAALTLLLDILKATIAGGIVYAITNNILQSQVAATAAVLGHIFPIWLKFKGGKGVASGIGAVLFMEPIAALFTCSVWLITARVFKYSSLAALISLGLLPFFELFIMGNFPIFCLFLFLSLVIIARHKQNIKRLIKGEESKIKL